MFMEKISPIKQRILQFIDYKGITKLLFCEKVGISYSNLKGKSLSSELGGDALCEILSIYSEISPDWLIVGKGEMLRSGALQRIEFSPDMELVVGKMLKRIEELSNENGQLKARLQALEEDCAKKRSASGFSYSQVAEPPVEYRKK